MSSSTHDARDCHRQHVNFLIQKRISNVEKTTSETRCCSHIFCRQVWRWKYLWLSLQHQMFAPPHRLRWAFWCWQKPPLRYADRLHPPDERNCTHVCWVVMVLIIGVQKKRTPCVIYTRSFTSTPNIDAYHHEQEDICCSTGNTYTVEALQRSWEVLFEHRMCASIAMCWRSLREVALNN